MVELTRVPPFLGNVFNDLIRESKLMMKTLFEQVKDYVHEIAPEKGIYCKVV